MEKAMRRIRIPLSYTHTPRGLRIWGSDTKYPPQRLPPHDGQTKLWARPVCQDNSSPLPRRTVKHTPPTLRPEPIASYRYWVRLFLSLCMEDTPLCTIHRGLMRKRALKVSFKYGKRFPTRGSRSVRAGPSGCADTASADRPPSAATGQVKPTERLCLPPVLWSLGLFCICNDYFRFCADDKIGLLVMWNL